MHTRERDEISLADLRNVISWRLRGLRQQVGALTGIRLYLRNQRRDIRLGCTGIGNVRHGSSLPH
jgi:hypothetical protein